MTRFEDETGPMGTSTDEQERGLVEYLGIWQRTKLKLSRVRKKRHWLEDDVEYEYLFDRLVEEVEELREAVAHEKDHVAVWSESADVANFAAMIADLFSYRLERERS